MLRETKRGEATRIPIHTGPANAPTLRGSGSPNVPPRPRSVIPPPRPPRRRRLLLVVLLLVLVLLGLAVGKLLSVGGAVLTSERPILAQLADLLFRRGTLQGEKENRVNILLAAVGGEGHQGENLADTVILASFRPQDKDVALFSIPRDLYVKIPDTEVYTKINAVHAYGENQKRGQGLALLRRKVAEITGQSVHYAARVDFLAFKRIVDEIGGVEIAIPEGFYDFWHRINFPKGTEHMNGDRALAYVRARYIEGPEGGDFKRQARIQQVLLAIRKKVLSAETAVDLRTLAGILDALRENVATNFSLGELKRLADLSRDTPHENIHSAVLTTGADGLLAGSTEILGGKPASVLKPRAGLDNYGEIQAFAGDIFARARTAPPPAGEDGLHRGGLVPSATPSPTPATMESEQPSVEIRNGTLATGLGARTAKAASKLGFNVLAVGNAAIRNRTQTVVVDRTGGKKPQSLRALLDALGVGTAVNFPEAEKETIDANFVVFLGSDVAEKFKK